MFGQQLVDGLKSSHWTYPTMITSGPPHDAAFDGLINGHATYDFYDRETLLDEC